jgi:hypothetical protein
MPSPATPRDPSGLLARIPELAPLCEDRFVRWAVATGDALRVHRVLFLVWLTGRLRRHRVAVRQLLRRRRAFARPVRRLPYLGSWNGLGSTMIGRAEAEPDGTRIATHVLVFILGIPVFPLRAYLVKPAHPGRYDENWYFYSRVPLGVFAWLWNRAVSLAAVLVVVSAASGMYQSIRHNDVLVVNGFEQPIHLLIGKASFEVAAGDVERLSLPVGTLPARATTSTGEVLDEGLLQVGWGSGLRVWNVGGVAPVEEEEIEYVTDPTPKAQPTSAPVVHCGERWLTFRDVDFAFVEPPKRLDDPFHGDPRIVKRAVLVAERPGVDGALLCAWLAIDHGNDWRTATAILERRARASGWERQATGHALWAARQVSVAEEQRILRAAHDAHRDDVSAEPPRSP